MNWDLVANIVIAVVGLVLTYQSFMSGRIRKAESDLRTNELKGINDGIKRVHKRIDDVENSQEKLLENLHDGNNGVFVRLTKIETTLKMDDN